MSNVQPGKFFAHPSLIYQIKQFANSFLLTFLYFFTFSNKHTHTHKKKKDKTEIVTKEGEAQGLVNI